MINVNLIAERRDRKLRELNTLRWSTIAVLLTMLAMVLFNVLLWYQQINAQHALEGVQAELVGLTQQRAELQKVQDEISAKRPIVRLLEQVRVSEGAWMTILADCSRIVPRDVAFTTLATNAADDGVKLRIAGRAKDEKTVGAFMLQLSQQTRWAEIPKVQVINSEGRQGAGSNTVQFDLSVPVRGLYGGEF